MNNNNPEKSIGIFKPPSNYNKVFTNEGKYYDFSPTNIKILSLKTPYPAAWRISSEDPFWRCYVPTSEFYKLLTKPTNNSLKSVNPVKVSLAKYKLENFNRCVSYLGNDCVKRIKRFSKDYQWYVFCLISRSKQYSFRMIDESPQLFFILSSCGPYLRKLKSKKYWGVAVNNLAKKRKEIFSYYNLHPSILKLLKKIPLKILSPFDVMYLKSITQHSKQARFKLEQLKKINKEILFLIQFPELFSEKVSLSLLKLLVSDDIKRREKWYLSSAIQHSYSLGNQLDEVIPVMKNQKQVYDLHNYLGEKLFQEDEKLNLSKNYFMKSPIKLKSDSTIQFRHIISYDELIQLGKRFRCCIGTKQYVRKIVNKKLAVYTFNTGNDEGIVTIKKQNSVWVFDEAKFSENRDVDDDSFDILLNRLEKCNCKLPLTFQNRNLPF